MDPSAEELSALLIALYQAAREAPLAEFQNGVLLLVKPWLRFDSCRWGNGQLTPAGVRIHRDHLFNEPADVLAAYDEIKHQDSAIQISMKRRGGMMAYNSARLFSGKARNGVRAYTRRNAHENVMMATGLDARTQLARWMSFYRAKEANEYGERDKRLAGLMVPHLFEALALNRIAHLERAHPEHGKRHYQLAIADCAGVLHHAEAGFVELLRDETGSRSPRVLTRDAVAALLTEGGFAGRLMFIRSSTVADLLFLKARRAVAADRLSRRERQIATEVANGRTYKEIARRHAIAPTTVRTHIQRIHQKLGSHNPATLARQLNLAS